MKNLYLLPTDKPSIICKDETGKFHVTESMISKISFFKNQNIYITFNEEIKEGDCFIYRCYKVYKCTGLSQSKQILTDNEIAKHKDYGKPQSLSRKIILTTDQDLIKNGVQAIDDEFLEWFIKNPNCEFVEIEKCKYLFCKHCDNLHSTYSDGINCDVCRRQSNPYLKCLGYKIIIPKEEPFKHKVKSLSKEEVLANRSNAYEFFDFDKQKTLEEKLDEIVSKEPSKFWKESDERILEEAAKEIFKGDYICNGIDLVRSAWMGGFIAGAKWQAERMYNEEDMRKSFRYGHNAARKGSYNQITEQEDFDKWFDQFKNKH